MFSTRFGKPLNLYGKFPTALILVALSAAGCGQKNVSGPVKLVPVTLESRSLGAAGQGAPATGTFHLATAAEGDTIPVTFTEALLVVRDVRFKVSDDGEADSLDAEPDQGDSLGDVEGDGEGMVIFRGPFVIDLLAGRADSLDTQMAPPGLYRRVQGHLRMLRAGDWNASDFDFLIGSTVYLTGVVDGEGGGPFTYQARIDNEFMVRGSFAVEEDTPATAFIALDHTRWLRAQDGTFLDPRIPENDFAIQWAIRHSIKVGMDENHDGEMDDDLSVAGD